MAGYTTIKELIESLKEQENLDAPVIYQYYLAEHFEVSDEVFGKVASDFESLIPCEDAYGTILSATKGST